jgi:hypothetical protein
MGMLNKQPVIRANEWKYLFFSVGTLMALAWEPLQQRNQQVTTHPVVDPQAGMDLDSFHKVKPGIEMWTH